MIHMGQNSLYIFCLSILLSHLGLLCLLEFHSGSAAHLGVAAAGVAIMAAAKPDLVIWETDSVC